MKAIIVAGGEGKRLRPLTETIPKPMVQVGGKPILEHTINLLKEHGVTDFSIALCYLPQPIIDYFGDGSRFGIHITYTFEDTSNPLGTAGAVREALQQINEPCIVTYADTLRDLNITEMVNQHKQSNSIATINVYKHTGENYKSSLLFTEDLTLTSFKELPTSTTLNEGESVWSNGSFYILEPEVLKYIQQKTKVDFAIDVFPSLLQDNKKISVFKSSSYFIDIGTPETLAKAEKILKENNLST